MGESQESNGNQERQPRQLRGLYRNVKISIKTLDTIIITCIVVIVVLLAIDLRNPGFTITFDSKGGTDVAPQNQMYGQLLDMPEPPTREGYVVTGWYRDAACDNPWQAQTDTIQEDLTLYAGWKPK